MSSQFRENNSGGQNPQSALRTSNRKGRYNLRRNVSDGPADQQQQEEEQNTQMVENLGEPSTSAGGAMDRPNDGDIQEVPVTPANSATPSTPALGIRSPKLRQLLELLKQLEQVDREVEAFSGGEGSEGAYRGLEERLTRLLCSVDGVEVGKQQALRDLQKHTNASITKSMRELERKAGVTTEKSVAVVKDGNLENGAADVDCQAMWVLEERSQENEPIEPKTELLLDKKLVRLVTRGAEGELVLDEEALRRVVCRPEVRDRKLAIISVVGPHCSGKSHLIGRMRDYLAAMTEEGACQLAEAEPGAEMLLWSEPFIISDDLAVILVESVLTEDMQVFALSTLVSSLQVISITAESFTWPGSDMLQFLKEFCVCVTTNLDDKALQRCVALFRDDARELKKGTEVYGLPGGAHLLDKWLDEIHQCPTKMKLLSMILSSYQQFDSFARPAEFKNKHRLSRRIRHPIVDTMPGWLGEHLVEWMLQPSRLSPKLLGCRELRAHELPTLLTCLVHELQRPNLSPAGLVTCLGRMEHERLLGVALRVYQRQVLDLLETAQDPVALHRTVVERLLDHVEQHKVFGDSDLADEYRNQLLQAFIVQYDTAIAPCVAERESARQSRMKQATDVALAFYQHEMSSKRPWDASRSLEDVSKIVFQKAEAKFLEKVGDAATPEEHNKKINKLKRKAAAYCEVLVPEYKRWRSAESKARVEQGYRDALRVYRAQMEQPDLSKKLTLVQQHQQATRKALDELRSAFPGEDTALDLMSQLITKLYQEMKVMQKEFEYTKEQRRKNKEDELERLKYLAVATFEKAAKACMKKMEDKTKLPVTLEALMIFLDNAERRAMKLFEPLQWQGCGKKEYPFIENSARLDIYALRTKCQEVWDKRVHTEVQKMSDACIQKHKVAIRAVHENEGPSDDDESVDDDVMDVMVAIVWQGFPKEVKVYGEELCRTVIADRIKVFDKRCQEFAKLAEKRMKMGPVTRAVKDFDKDMEQFFPATISRATLDQHYADSKAATLERIRKALKDSPKLEEDLKRADEHLERTLADVRMRIEEDHKEELAFQDALAAYKVEMGELLKCACTPNDYTVLTLHTSAHKTAINSYMAVATAGDTKRAGMQTFLVQLEQGISLELDNIKSHLVVQHRDDGIEENEVNKSIGSVKNYAIGIDLGTTFSCASVYKDGKVIPIVNKDKKHTTPSVVYFGQHGVLVGEEAKFKGFEDPVNCISEVKRIIGRTSDDPVVKSVPKLWAFTLTSQSNKPLIRVDHGDKKTYSPEEVSALVMKELKRQAEVQLGSEVHDAVVTIPAYFTEPQRAATLRACKEAGLNVLRLLNEPTAAAMAYGLQTLTQEEQNNSNNANYSNIEGKCHRVLVFDFGGGTCDVSILELCGSHFVVKASRGDNQLGGEDYDNRLTQHITDKLKMKNRSLKLDTKSNRRLRYMAEIAKCRLTNSHDYHIHMPNFPKMGQDLDETVHRSVFEKITEDLSKRTLVPVRECLQEAGMSKDDIEIIVLAGGSSRIPKVQQLLMEFFPGKPLYDKINPDEAIACGAALQAALLTGECERAMRITDITPFSLGTDVLYDRCSIIVKRNSQIPCSNTERFITADSGQTAMLIRVYQGENTEDEYKNTKLAEFILENLTPARAGETKVDVTFEIDKNGILLVTAEEVCSNTVKKNKKSLTITKRVN